MEYEKKFSLAKWYLDCVTEVGDAILGYAASLRWRMLSLNYSSILVRRSSGPVEAKTTLQRGTLPHEGPNSVLWDCPHLAVHGKWKGVEPSFERAIFESSATPMTWRCVQPRAEAEIDAGSLGRFKGFGYIDFVEMTSKPWLLPLEELRWGRFLSSSDSIIWLDLKGPVSECLVFYNGTSAVNGRVLDTGIDLGQINTHLTFEETEVLREGTLASTALSVIPGVHKLLPERMLNTDECKWRSRGVLRSGNKTKSTGWVIHEVVKWPSSGDTPKT